MTTTISYASVYPLPVDSGEIHWPEPKIFMRVNDSIQSEDISELMRKSSPGFWRDWSYAHGELDSKRLQNIRYALVRRFDCGEPDEPKERELSKILLYRLYLILKVIRATRQRFLVFHFAEANGRSTIKEPWRNEFDSELLDCEFGFPLGLEDLRRLPSIAQLSLNMLGNRTLPITQAVYNLEIGYRAEFFNVKHLIWVVGLDALFSTDKNTPSATVKARIRDFLGEDFVTYPDQRDICLPRLIGLSLTDALGEIYELRHHFAHGTWPDKNWAGKVCRAPATGTIEVLYSGMLLEAAAVILRACLTKILGHPNLIEVFNDKAKMDAYFLSRGSAFTPREEAR